MAGSAIIATLILGGMCGAMWFLARLARKRMGIGSGTVSSDGLRVVGKRPLDQKNALYVIEIAGGRHILVGASADGGVAKIDDILPEEFASMTEDEPKERTARRLRVATPGAAATHEEDASPAEAGADDEQRFATVGESFSMLLGKARRRASGE